MTQSKFIRSIAWVATCFLIAALVAWPAAISADTSKYFYDELGRLAAVIDGQGNVAVYTYDAVGNLVSIQRFTSSGGGGTIGIFVVTPGSALVGATVQIQGFGFSPTASNNQVNFNGTPATVSSATANSITTTVPSGATTGPITVTNTNGTATSPQAFTVLVPPIVSGIDPAQVPQGTTTRVNISGFNLATATSVSFTQTGITAAIQSGATSQTLTVNLVVASTVPAGSYTFSVTTPAGMVQSGTITVTVKPKSPSLGIAKLSVFLPVITTVPATIGPGAGSHEDAASPVSVSMPVNTTVPATSGPPAGQDFSVAPPTSVSMP